MSTWLKDQKGLAALEVVLGVLLLVAIGAAGYFAYKDHHDTRQGSAATTQKSPVATPTKTPITLPGQNSTTSPGYAEALEACQTWQVSDHQDAATGSGTMQTAAAQANMAAGLSQQWKTLAENMTFVSSLPETGNTQADVAQATTDEKIIQSSCATLGVQVSDD